MDDSAPILSQADEAQRQTLLEAKPEVVRPNRQTRRAQLKEARRGYSVVLSEGQKRDHAMVVAKKAWCKRRSGNPLKAATMFFSWVEIQNAFRGHV